MRNASRIMSLQRTRNARPATTDGSQSTRPPARDQNVRRRTSSLPTCAKSRLRPAASFPESVHFPGARPAPFTWLAASCHDGSNLDFSGRLVVSYSSIEVEPRSGRSAAYDRRASVTLELSVLMGAPSAFRCIHDICSPVMAPKRRRKFLSNELRSIDGEIAHIRFAIEREFSEDYSEPVLAIAYWRQRLLDLLGGRSLLPHQRESIFGLLKRIEKYDDI